MQMSTNFWARLPEFGSQSLCVLCVVGQFIEILYTIHYHTLLLFINNELSVFVGRESQYLQLELSLDSVFYNGYHNIGQLGG